MTRSAPAAAPRHDSPSTSSGGSQMSHGITTNDQMFASAALRGTGSASSSRSTRGRSTTHSTRPVSAGRSRTATSWSSRRRSGPTTSAPSTPAELIPAKGFKANLREDTGEVLGIVSDEYEVVDNRRRVPVPRRADRLRASLRDRRQPVGRPARLVPGPAARIHRARRRPVGDLHLRGQQPRRVDGGHRRRHADQDRVRQHARGGAAPGRARRPRRSGRSASATPATCRPSSPRPGR